MLILAALVAVLLILVVLLQNSKGGLVSGMSSTSQVIGAKRSTDAIEKATWGFGGGLAALCVIINLLVVPTDTSAGGESEILKGAEQEQFVPGAGADGGLQLAPEAGQDDTEDAGDDGGLQLEPGQDEGDN